MRFLKYFLKNNINPALENNVQMKMAENWRLALYLPFVLLQLSCSGRATPMPEVDKMPLTVLQSKQLELTDGRSRFRQIFCHILDDHGHKLPDFQPCHEALVYTDEQVLKTTAPVDLAPAKNNFLIGLVPGLAWQCVREWLDNDGAGMRQIMAQGYDIRLFEVDGLSSTANNARQIHHYYSILSTEEKQRPIILIGYSKGAADVLQAITLYPEITKRVVAIVSIAGAVRGSPLAKRITQSQLNILAHIPKSGCDIGDNGALQSIYPETRKKWLADNVLPENIRYYSIIAYPEPERISFGLQHSYEELRQIEGLNNDGQIIFHDQLIPGSTLLALVNADHWAMSIPIARQKALNRLTFANKNEYPREALLEAVLRYIEEDLAKAAQHQTLTFP